MTTELIKPEVKIARPLSVVMQWIRVELTNLEDASMEYYRRVGLLLREAQVHVDRGKWGKWLRENFELSQATARNYMNWAGECEFVEAIEKVDDTNSERAQNHQPRKYKTLSEFTEPKRNPNHRPQWYQPVQQTLDNLNVSRMRQDRLDREKETMLQRQLGLQLIDIGYKVLATKLHPDKGGSEEAMVRLHKVRDRLKGVL